MHAKLPGIVWTFHVLKKMNVFFVWRDIVLYRNELYEINNWTIWVFDVFLLQVFVLTGYEEGEVGKN